MIQFLGIQETFADFQSSFISYLKAYVSWIDNVEHAWNDAFENAIGKINIDQFFLLYCHPAILWRIMILGKFGVTPMFAPLNIAYRESEKLSFHKYLNITVSHVLKKEKFALLS